MKFIKKYKLHLIIGALAGTINGLLGAGGGIIITYYLAHILSDEEKSNNGVFANAVATMLPVSIISLALYLSRDYFKFNNELFSLLPAAIIGGILGAFLLTKLKLKVVKLIFSVLITISGLFMLFK